MAHRGGWRRAMPVHLVRCISSGASRPARRRRRRPAGSPRPARPPAASGRIRPSGSASGRTDAFAARCAPGLRVTSAPPARAGSGGLNSGSIRTVPVNHSAGPRPDGCDPARLISIADLPRSPGASFVQAVRRDATGVQVHFDETRRHRRPSPFRRDATPQASKSISTRRDATGVQVHFDETQRHRRPCPSRRKDPRSARRQS
jgi:hypothetical protein